ncbi:hypothetical protein J4S47_004746 [Salmonella enterica]|nr:hypothetical protein [Salmonella enterica]EMB9904353.1 hypothetical protein [Salmonella enterica]
MTVKRVRFLTKKGPSGEAGKEYTAREAGFRVMPACFSTSGGGGMLEFPHNQQKENVMFENQVALAVALSLLTEKDKVSKSQYFEKLIAVYSEIEKAIESGDPVTFFKSPPLTIAADFVNDI